MCVANLNPVDVSRQVKNLYDTKSPAVDMASSPVFFGSNALRRVSITEAVYKCFEIANSNSCFEDVGLRFSAFIDSDGSQVQIAARDSAGDCLTAVQVDLLDVDAAEEDRDAPESDDEERSSFSDEELTQIAGRLRAIGDGLERDFQEMAPNNAFVRDLTSAGCSNVGKLFRSAVLVARIIAGRFSRR